MIRNPLLPPIIRPDLIAPPHPRHPNNTHPQRRFLLLPRLSPHLRHLRPQDPPRLLPVLMLRSPVLDADGRGGGDMRQADGGIGGVDMLAAGAAGTHDVGADVGRVDVEIARGVIGAEFRRPGRIAFLIGEAGEHEHGGGTGVCAALGFGCGDTLDAVDAGFAFEAVVGAGGIDFEDRFVDAGGGGFGGGFGVEFDEGVVQGVAFAVGLVHAEEISDEEAGFGTAGAGADFQKAWEGGEGIAGN